MNKKGFVYVWKNLTNNKKYIGYHVGNVDDGYVSSSKNNDFWDDFNNKEMTWIREILLTGDSCTCLKYEQKLLKDIDINSDEYYNNARGAEIIFTDSVRNKMSISSKKRWKNISENDRKIRNLKISNSKKGKKEVMKLIKN